MEIIDGWLANARKVISPNYDARPDPADISLVIIHGISLPPSEYGGPYIEQLFTNVLDPNEHPYFAEIQHLRVSAHLLIRRDGELVQFVPFDQRAWHAGVSEYRGRTVCNDFSIGIELEGSDYEPYAEIQYSQLALVVCSLLGAFKGLCRDRIVGHSDVSPGRKTDPGPHFNWERLRFLVGIQLE